MASLNRVTLIGHLGADPEVRYTQNREAIATIRIATTETYKDKSSGEKKEITEWHRVVFFGRTAEVVGEYLKKGSPVYVEGRIQTRKWQDKETGQDRYSTEVVLQNFNSTLTMLDGRSGGAGMSDDGGNEFGSTGTAPRARVAASGKRNDLDDDIPF